MNPVRAWNRFWFARASARPLGAFRIAFGLAVLLHLALLAVEPDPWLSDAGYMQGAEARQFASALRPSLLHWVQSPAAVRATLAVTAAAAVLVTVGWRTRVMSVLLYLGALSIHHRMMLVLNGADTLIVSFAFALVLSPCGAALSLDARRAARKRGAPAEPVIVPWAQRLVQIQVSILYFMTALLKAHGKTWLDGTATYYVSQNVEFARFSLGMEHSPVLSQALSLGTVVIEFALAFLLWNRKARPWAILAGMALHAGTLLTVNAPVFSELMLASYLTFLDGADWDRLARIFGRLRGTKATELSGRVDAPAQALAGPHRRRRPPRVATASASKEPTTEIAASSRNRVGS